MLARTLSFRPLTGDLARMSREMDRLFESLAPAVPGAAERSKGRIAPPVNLWQDDANFYAEAELPGVSAEDLEITAHGDTLTIKGTRQPAHDAQSAPEMIRAERFHGSFERTLTLPVEIDAEKVDASLKNGVLTVTLPKAQAVLPRTIAVNAG